MSGVIGGAKPGVKAVTVAAVLGKLNPVTFLVWCVTTIARANRAVCITLTPDHPVNVQRRADWEAANAKLKAKGSAQARATLAQREATGFKNLGPETGPWVNPRTHYLMSGDTPDAVQRILVGRNAETGEPFVRSLLEVFTRAVLLGTLDGAPETSGRDAATVKAAIAEFLTVTGRKAEAEGLLAHRYQGGNLYAPPDMVTPKERGRKLAVQDSAAASLTVADFAAAAAIVPTSPTA